jgi:dTMP kinase
MSGIFISFEGIDGAGKSTHIEALAKSFEAQGRVVTQTREPGGTPLAEKLRGMVLNDPMDAITETLLVFAARRDHLQSLIEPALARGEVVLCDRFTDATFAYQGGGRGLDLEMLATLEHWVQKKPGSTVDSAAQRLAGARIPDKFEAQPIEFFQKVAAGYALRQAQYPQRFVKIDASQPKHKVWQQITLAMVRRGWLAIMVAANAGPN